VDGKRGRAQRAHPRMGARLIRLVAVMENQDTLGEEEEHEACADEREGVARREKLERLRQDVEECNGDHDAAGEGDQSRQLGPQTKGEEAACQRREDGDSGERNCDPDQMRTILVITGRKIHFER
jgi:hypothetical protein